MSDQDGSFDIHNDIVYGILCQITHVIKWRFMPFYDILWHMPYDINCHQVCQYGYQKNRLDQTNWSKGCRIFFREQNLTQNPKTEIAIFPLYFLGVSFIIFNEFVGGSNYLEIKKSFFSRPIHMIEHKIPEGQKIWTSFIIFTLPYCTR